MDYCLFCGEPIHSTKEIYRNLKYCSYNCKDSDLLNKCKAGDISFLDLPQDTYNRERGSKRALKSHAHKCLRCGIIFYTTHEKEIKYCSDDCRNVALAPIYKLYSAKNAGIGSHNWKGGISYEPYCPKFNNNLKARVRAFFENKCFLCGISETQLNKNLSVHHVNYNKSSCCDYSKPLFVPLCSSCHSKTNTNRGHWEKHFKTEIKTKYNNKCYYLIKEYKEHLDRARG